MRGKNVYRVLVVGDEAKMRLLVKMAIKSDNYSVIEARSSIEGLVKVNLVNPDIIISDIMMPNMEGVIFCQQVRKDSTLSFIPFILLTDFESDLKLFDGFQVGVDELLTKENIGRARLTQTLKHLITLKHTLAHSPYFTGVSINSNRNLLN